MQARGRSMWPHGQAAACHGSRSAKLARDPRGLEGGPFLIDFGRFRFWIRYLVTAYASAAWSWLSIGAHRLLAPQGFWTWLIVKALKFPKSWFWTGLVNNWSRILHHTRIEKQQQQANGFYMLRLARNGNEDQPSTTLGRDCEKVFFAPNFVCGATRGCDRWGWWGQELSSVSLWREKENSSKIEKVEQTEQLAPRSVSQKYVGLLQTGNLKTSFLRFTWSLAENCRKLYFFSVSQSVGRSVI